VMRTLGCRHDMLAAAATAAASAAAAAPNAAHTFNNLNYKV